MSGDEVVFKLQQDPVLKKVVVIMQTADTRSGKAGEALEEGVDFYLMKPYHPQKLKTLLKAAIRFREKKNSNESDDMSGPLSFVDRIKH